MCNEGTSEYNLNLLKIKNGGHGVHISTIFNSSVLDHLQMESYL